MKHLSTAEVIGILGTAQEELARRFCGAQPVRTQLDPPEMGLLQDATSKQYFYSVCGHTSQCSCRYVIVPATRWAAGDMQKRPQIDPRVLYVYGLDTKTNSTEESHAKLRAMVARFEPSAVTVVRSYGFLTFPTHAAAAAAQRLLCTKGLSVSFNRVMEPERKARGKRGGRGRRARVDTASEEAE